MNIKLRRILAVVLLFAARSAIGHEFWVLPDNFYPPAGGSAALTMAVGENFAGERVGFARPLLASFRQFSARGVADLAAQVPPGNPVAQHAVRLAQPGTYLIALDTQPTQITLEAGKFHAYLHEEGLDWVIQAREKSGKAALPGRERYRRNIKTLIEAGGRSDATYAQRTGQKLEIVPMANPSKQQGGADISFQVVWEGRPLAKALVKFWHRRNAQTLVVRTISDAEGKVTVTLPWTGVWMASVVHMTPVTDSPDVDWESYWGNLTFALPERR